MDEVGWDARLKRMTEATTPIPKPIPLQRTPLTNVRKVEGISRTHVFTNRSATLLPKLDARFLGTRAEKHTATVVLGMVRILCNRVLTDYVPFG